MFIKNVLSGAAANLWSFGSTALGAANYLMASAVSNLAAIGGIAKDYLTGNKGGNSSGSPIVQNSLDISRISAAEPHSKTTSNCCSSSLRDTKAEESVSSVDYKSYSAPKTRVEEGPALVIGIWKPGIPNKIVTVALDPDTEISRFENNYNPKYVPDFRNDFMAIPAEKLGERKFTRIVFQGVCPVANAMGASSCGANQNYEDIDIKQLAQKVKQLISNRGGVVFFRHCIASANEKGISNTAQREAFIQAFQEAGLELTQDFEDGPGQDIPDSHSDEEHKWKAKNGGLIFFLPSSQMAHS